MRHHWLSVVLLALATVAVVATACRGDGGIDPSADSDVDSGDGGGDADADGDDDNPTCAATDESCGGTNPCCDPAHDICVGPDVDNRHCRSQCTPTTCDYGGADGICSLSLCFPLDGDPAESECTAGTAGCETEYAVSEGTECSSWTGSEGTVSYCLETCTPSETGCDEHHDCQRLTGSADGICSPL